MESPEERKIRELHATWIEAVNAGDPARLLSLMTVDAVLLNPGQAPVGREAFSANFPAAHEQFRIHCTSELEDVVVVGDVAFTRCREELSVTPRAGGETSEFAGHRLTVYRKQTDGRWLLARDAHTLSPVEMGSHGSPTLDSTRPTSGAHATMLKLLDDFARAWNRHDLDALMSMMTDDCVFEASGGGQVDGERSVGREAVRAAFAAAFEQFPDAHWGNARHFVAGDRGWSEWTFTGTLRDGRRVEVNGCDLFTFRDGRIAIKNSFRKNRPPFTG